MNNDLHFSSDSDEWQTPPDLYERLNKEFFFTLDPASTDTNYLCSKHFTLKEDGLRQSWAGERCFVNPPYSKLYDWVRKVYTEKENGVISVMLIPARTDTRAFHNYIWNEATNRCYVGTQVRFLRGRLKFSGARNSAPFPSMIVIFGI